MGKTVPSKFLDLVESAGLLYLRNWKFALRWGGWYLLWIFVALAALGAACAATLPGLFESAKDGGGAWESPWFAPAVLAIACAAVGLLALGTAASVSSSRAARDLWEGKTPGAASAYWTTGGREVITSIPFFLRGTWYLLWPAGALAALGIVVVALGADVGGPGGNAMAFLGYAGLVVTMFWGLGRLVRLQMAAYAAAWSGDWSRESFVGGIAMTYGKFWRTFWRALGFSTIWGLLTQMVVGLPAGIVGGVLTMAAIPFVPDWVLVLEAKSGALSSMAGGLLGGVVGAMLTLLPMAFYGLLATGLRQEAEAPRA